MFSLSKVTRFVVDRNRPVPVKVDCVDNFVIKPLGIYLDKSSLYDEVATELAKIPEVVGANYTTGVYSIFAKIICRDTTHLRDVLHDKIQPIKGIQRTETFISLEESINRPLNIIDEE